MKKNSIRPSGFSEDAWQLWESISPEIQRKITANVWCSFCHQAVEIKDYGGRVEGLSIVLTGRCKKCDGPVARVIEEVTTTAIEGR